MNQQEKDAIAQHRPSLSSELEKKCADYEDALRFYANQKHWDDVYYDGDDEIDVSGDIQHKICLSDVEYKEDSEAEIISACAGKRAREVLKKYEVKE